MLQFYFQTQKEADEFVEGLPFNFPVYEEQGINCCDPGYDHLVEIDTGGNHTLAWLW